MKPFLKWAGGKRQLLPIIKQYIPETFNTYHEVFVGAGAVFLNLERDNSYINDKNSELINCYLVIRDNIDELIKELKTYKNDKDFFLNMRMMDRLSDYSTISKVKKAARFIYLNRTCFNGLYRVNKEGYFNVPFGNYKNPNIVNEETLREIHKYLNDNNIKIFNLDFEEYLKNVKKNDFVYLDPPYDPINKTSDFTSYNKDGFSQDDQRRLKKELDKLNQKGIKWLLSNSCTDFIKELYKEYTIIEVEAKRNISSDSSKRGSIQEVLIKNY